VTLSGVTTETAVTALTASYGGSSYAYGTNDMNTDADGKLYLYLPENTLTMSARTLSHGYLGAITTTMSSAESIGTLTVDDSAPAISSVIPTGTGIALSGNITVTFNEAMDTTTAGTVYP